MLKPDLIIFMTNDSYDKHIEAIFDNSFKIGADKHLIGKKEMPWAEFSGIIGNKPMVCLRIGHPERKNKTKYIDNVTGWINKKINNQI